MQRRGIVVVAHHLTPPLRFHLLEDAACVAGGDPAVAATLRAAPAKGNTFSAVRTDDDERVRQLEFLLALSVQTIQKRCEIAEGLFKRNGSRVRQLHRSRRVSS